jgi:hypothetical protein
MALTALQLVKRIQSGGFSDPQVLPTRIRWALQGSPPAYTMDYVWSEAPSSREKPHDSIISSGEPSLRCPGQAHVHTPDRVTRDAKAQCTRFISAYQSALRWSSCQGEEIADGHGCGCGAAVARRLDGWLWVCRVKRHGSWCMACCQGGRPG